MVRLDKFLADAGLGTRSEVKNFIKKGAVRISGETIRLPDYKFDPALETVLYQNEPVSVEKFEYYMFYKPAGCVSATSDLQSKTVLDFIRSPKKKELFPVGRLDKDTEGLLLITNDGELAHELLSPRKHVDKTYYVKAEGMLTEADIVQMKAGIEIGEKRPTLPAVLNILVSGQISEAELTIREGKFHQVKRMFQSVGKPVIYLKRLSMGSLVLDETLKPGEYRPLTKEELQKLKKTKKQKIE